MKNIYSLISTLIITLIISGCTRESFLDIAPRGVSIPNTLNDYRLLLDQVDIDFDVNSSTDGFDETHFITTFINDDFFIDESLQNSALIRSGNDIIRAYRFEDFIYLADQDDPNWDNYYAQIFLSNIILDGLQDVVDGTPQEVAALEAEAKLHRAFAYFNLVNIYALHYNPSTADTDLGVPIREGIALEDVDLSRNSVSEVYDLIIDDVETSIANLPDTQPGQLIFRPSKIAAYGLLAKIYLFQGNYDLALIAADTALTIKNDLRNLIDDSQSSIIPSVIALPPILLDNEILWYKEFSGRYFVNQGFFDTYQLEDLRRSWFASIEEAFGITSEGMYLAAGVDNGEVANGINTPELFLIRAECNARLNNFESANADINTLREHRFTSFTPIDETNPTILLNIIKDERRKELINGNTRFFDIKRYNRLDGDNISVTHTINGEVFELPPNDPKWALPIPPKYIILNPEMEQNPRN